MNELITTWFGSLPEKQSTVSMKKFPFLRVAVASFAMFASGFAVMSVFAFQPFMVNGFFPNLTKEQLGWKTGYLGTAYFLGNFFGSLIFGWLADNWGRRPCLLLGNIGSIVFATFFGFSKTFYFAVSTRFGWGLVNSSFDVVIKTYLSEILDDSQQATGFSVFAAAFGASRILGPIAGGYLAQPAEKYEIFNIQFFCDNPFMMPMLISDAIFVISLIGVYLFIEETRQTDKREKLVKSMPQKIESDSDSSSTDEFTDLYSNSDIEYQRINGGNCYNGHGLCADTCRHLVHVQRQQLTCIINCLVCGQRCKRNQPETVMKKTEPEYTRKNFFFLLRNHLNSDIVLSVIIYIVAGSAGFMIFEIFTLLIISDKQHGGYNMTDQDIGFCFLVIGIAELLYQLVYSKLLRLLGIRKLLVIGVISFAIMNLIFPWSSSLPIPNIINSTAVEEWQLNETIFLCGYNISRAASGDFDLQRKPALIWIIVALPLAVIMIGRVTGMVTGGLLVNNVAPPAIKGTVNGIAQALMSIFRATGYLVAALMFAWSQNNGKSWPLNYHFTFILLTVMLLCLLPLIFSLSKSVEKKNLKQLK